MTAYRRVKRDSNHAEIARALEMCGWLVLDLSAVGNGVPDLLVYHPARRAMGFVECKRPGVAGKKRGRHQQDVNDRQATFRARWPVKVIEIAHQAALL